VSKSSIKLFWYVTPHRFEDWFVIARTARLARKWAYLAEGIFFETDAEATEVVVEEICSVPSAARSIAQERIGDDIGAWPGDAVLTACGATFLPRDGEDLVVRLGDRVFHQGGSRQVRIERRFRLMAEDFDHLAASADAWMEKLRHLLEDVGEFADERLVQQVATPERADRLTRALARVREHMTAQSAMRPDVLELERATGDVLRHIVRRN
jgi:hypothetical protein